jgi:hypothetical protein
VHEPTSNTCKATQAVDSRSANSAESNPNTHSPWNSPCPANALVEHLKPDCRQADSSVLVRVVECIGVRTDTQRNSSWPGETNLPSKGEYIAADLSIAPKLSLAVLRRTAPPEALSATSASKLGVVRSLISPGSALYPGLPHHLNKFNPCVLRRSHLMEEVDPGAFDSLTGLHAKREAQAVN